MHNFSLYFLTGWEHIMSAGALDHILFIAALSAIYLLRNWKQVLILVTAFTVGHSLTLVLSVYDWVRFSSRWVEFGIPCTIIATGLFNFFVKDFSPRSLRLNYWLALFFGLVHGMGFANTIRFMLAGQEQIGWPLLSFNLGLEAGQIVLVSCILLLGWLLVEKAQLNRHWWAGVISVTCILAAALMLPERWPL